MADLPLSQEHMQGNGINALDDASKEIKREYKGTADRRPRTNQIAYCQKCSYPSFYVSSDKGRCQRAEGPVWPFEASFYLFRHCWALLLFAWPPLSTGRRAYKGSGGLRGRRFYKLSNYINYN